MLGSLCVFMPGFMLLFVRIVIIVMCGVFSCVVVIGWLVVAKLFLPFSCRGSVNVGTHLQVVA